MSQQPDSFLLNLLVCPIDHEELLHIADQNVLYNPRLKKAYPIRDGIPVMLIEEAIDIDDKTHEEYVLNAS